MSKQIISNQKITRSYKISKTSEQYSSNPKPETTKIISKHNYIRNTIESSGGNNQQRSTDNQSICTCGKWKTETFSAYNGTIPTNIKSDENLTCDEGKDMSLCNCYKKHTNKLSRKTQSDNSQNILIQDNNKCTCGEGHIVQTSEEHEKNITTNTTRDINIINTNVLNLNINKKVCICGKGDHEAEIINTTASNNEFQVETIETKDEEDKEKIEQDQKFFNKEILIQSISNEKREALSWTGDIYIQIIERLQYLAAEPPLLTVQFLNDIMIDRTLDNKPIHILIPVPENFIQKQGEFEVLSEQKNREDNLCPENVDLLNISNAYSIQVPSFNNLEIENSEMFIQAQKKMAFSTEQYSLYCQGEKKLKIENYDLNINTTGKMWSGPLKPVRTNKLGIEEEEGEDWNNLIKKENVEKFEVEKIKKYYRFKQIELGDNEVILLKATKRVLKNYTQTEESTVTMGGKGFKQRVWEPVPFLANSMTIEKSSIQNQFSITSEKIEMAPERKRRADWNLVNTASLATSVNYLNEEKKEEEEDTNKWKSIVKKQSGIKLVFGKKAKKFTLTICKEINMFFEREVDDVIVNDDYNNIAGPQTRPIIVTVLKVNEEEDTSSVTSYDVFKNLVIQKSSVNISYGANSNYKAGGNYKINFIGSKSNKGTFFNSEFSDFAKKEGSFQLRMEENKQKNKYDKTVINLANHAKKIINGNIIHFESKKENIEYVGEEPDVKKFLKI